MENRFVLAMLGVVTACVGAPPPPQGESISALQECPEEYCGTNSPKIDIHGFHELSVSGRPNAQNMVLDRATLGAAPVRIRVQQGALIAEAGQTVFTGAALVGLRLTVLIDGLAFELELMSVGSMFFPVPAESGDLLPTYVFEYIDANGVRQNLCGNRPILLPSRDLLYWETFNQVPREAILFEGDRIDTSRMSIAAGFDADWFNIGCAGHTLSKLHLTRNTSASRASTYGHNLASRQATLKLLAADYCGTGRPFTVAGQPLAWRDPQQVMAFYSGASVLEARWNEHGATCLHKPRLLRPASAAGAQLFPDIWQAIASECPNLLSSPCQDLDIQSFDGQDRVSANR
ncbi:MAG TPA: ADYC domain-containing protein [Kofleriaceae bacterium]|nr:ADYC domain-containing protein [Kofleriaceae bacterium]